jgi:transglutaminase-like putative cysteine protease
MNQGPAKEGSSRQARRRRSASLRLFLLLAFLTILGAGLFYGYSWLVSPRIDSLSPVVVEPGGSVNLVGRNFGASRGDSRVEIDGVAPTASSYLAWHQGSITLRLPPAAESGLVYVVTKHGRSNAKLFMNRARLPVAPRGAVPSRSGPYITSLSAEKGVIGSLLVISGLNFGSNRGQGAVLFGWNPEGSSSGPDDRGASTFVRNADVDLGYEFWSDKEIRLRVPDGAASGSIIVDSGNGRSNAVFFAVADMPGQKHYKDRRSYSLAYSVSLTKVKAGLPNELDLWVPRPVESASQRIARILAQEPEPFVPDYRGAALYQFKDLSTAQDLKVSQSYLVQVWNVETSVEPDRIAKPADPPPLMAAYTAADDLVPAAAPEVLALARKIVGGERNPWRAARLVYDWLVKNMTWTESSLERKPLPALAMKIADTYSYSLLATALLRAAGIPALPVKGYLVDPSRNAARHAWVEFYVYGLGWVPMDPVLGSGASPGKFPVAFEDRARYFGNLDNRHVAFARGYTVFSPLSQTGRHASPQRPMANQSFYEEASGSLEAYSSFWSEVEVSGLY